MTTITRTAKFTICRVGAVTAILMAALPQAAGAATLQVQPQGAQPGDVLTLTVEPGPGEKIDAVQMAAFDTANVKFEPRRDGSRRAFLGFPFDRHGGDFELHASVTSSQSGAAPASAVVSARFRGVSRDFPTQYVTMRAATAATMSKKGALTREKAYVQSKMQNSSPVPLWSGAWILPCPGIATSSYGRRRYVNGHWWGQHNGCDIRAGTGTPIHATNSGRVVLSAYLPTLRGNCIVIDHGCNVYSLYFHQSKRLVSEGDVVRKGQLIGRVGATGFVTGPHLHWEMRIGWEPVDPMRVARRGLYF